MPQTDTEWSSPSRVANLLREAQSRIHTHQAQQRGHGKGFVASDFTRVHAALVRIEEEQLARGPLFCEWGSGFGVVAMLAALLGFEAYGIEVQPELVEAAEDLVEWLGCDVQFACGSFVPADDDDLVGTAEHSWWHASDGSAYDDLDIEPAAFDVFFAYPWPGEDGLFDTLFMRHASIGALLLTYHDGTGVLVQRKDSATGVPAVVGWY
ncbi:MAG: class I SAM-dependent methyltransferase [Phycisphaerales bacterium]|nr:class I SAM-dependent methyltransferase [Phycisphaerales bacterium]